MQLVNKVVKIWISKSEGVDKKNLNYPRYWLIFNNHENNTIDLVNLTSNLDTIFSHIDSKSECKMFGDIIDPKIDNDVTVKQENILTTTFSNNKELTDYVWNCCDCKDGCFSKNEFDKIKNEIEIANSLQIPETFIQGRVEELFKHISEWDVNKINLTANHWNFKNSQEMIDTNKIALNLSQGESEVSDIGLNTKKIDIEE